MICGSVALAILVPPLLLCIVFLLYGGFCATRVITGTGNPKHKEFLDRYGGL